MPANKLSATLQVELPDYLVSVAFLIISFAVHTAVFAGSLRNGYSLQLIQSSLFTFPIAAFTIYFTVRAFITDSIKALFSRPLFIGKYLIFIFQLFLLILLFDSYKQVIRLNPQLFMISLFTSDCISYVLTKILVHLHEWHLTNNDNDQFFFSSLKVFIWYIILPATYIFSVVFLHH